MQNNRLIITLFGASGDLAQRKLYPALYQLYKKKIISQHFAVIGTARREWTDDHFRQIIIASIINHCKDKREAMKFASHFYYQPHDVHNTDQYKNIRQLAEKLDQSYHTKGNRIFYISLSPQLFPIITKQLKKQGLITDSGYNRLIIEKPFGYNENSADILQKQLEESFEENQIYRIDHYLGKSLVNQILPIRFNNHIMKSIWTGETIDHIQITLNESIGVEDRGAYYETSGVSRDMIQNHALQLLALVTMFEPTPYNASGIRDEKIKILKNLTLFDGWDQANLNIVRGQYGPSLDGQHLGYREEKNVNKNSIIETFIALKLKINYGGWQHTPIYIRSGKHMATKQTDIKIVFKQIKKNIPANYLQFELAPNPGIRLYLSQSDSTHQEEIKPLNLFYTVPATICSEIPKDYEKLILDCIEGNLNNFAHYLEVKYAWQLIDRIQHYWSQEDTVCFPNYPAQSEGPKAGQDLILKDHRQWINH